MPFCSEENKMSSSLQSIYDDEQDWSDFKIKAGIVGTPWQLYSQEYDLAKQGFYSSRYEGRRLKLYVKQEIELFELKQAHQKELQELLHLENLERKYK
jgi:hypothetical protein